MDYQIHPLGENALIISLSEKICDNSGQMVQAVMKRLADRYIELVPSYTTVTVYYNPCDFQSNPYQTLSNDISSLLKDLSLEEKATPRIIDIPVCYGGIFGPDLNEVASLTGIKEQEVMELHQKGDYVVQVIGFSPGFPYISGLHEKIAVPRKASPRLKVPAGSVGIGGSQTGIYPFDSPGGWQIIGRTPLKLFDLEKNQPSLLLPGDKIRFFRISPEKFRLLEEGCR